MNVGRICSRPAVTVSASTSLLEVARLMCSEQVGAIVVTATPSTRPVVIGIITDRDIVAAQIGRATDLSCMRTEEFMASSPLSLCETESAAESIRRMRERGVRRAAVVAQDGALIGVVSTDDLLAYLTVEIVGLANMVASQRSAV